MIEIPKNSGDMKQGNTCAKNKSQLRPLVIIGSGGHAASVANVALSAGYKIKCFVDKNIMGSNLFGYSIIEDIGDIENMEANSFAIAVGDNAIRDRIHKELIALIPNLHFPTLIHSTAVISFFCEIDDGTVVMPGAVIGPNTKVGKFCLINTQACIDHDCEMSDYASLAPACATGGAVKIGLRSAICIGAVVSHGLKIGDDCVVGANSYLDKDLPNNYVAYGTPAKQIRIRNIGDTYLS